MSAIKGYGGNLDIGNSNSYGNDSSVKEFHENRKQISVALPLKKSGVADRGRSPSAEPGLDGWTSISRDASADSHGSARKTSSRSSSSNHEEWVYVSRGRFSNIPKNEESINVMPKKFRVSDPEENRVREERYKQITHNVKVAKVQQMKKSAN